MPKDRILANYGGDTSGLICGYLFEPDRLAAAIDLGYIDLEQKTLQPLDNRFGARLLPMY